MQVFKMVDPGRVDRLLAFEGLPEPLLKGIRRGAVSGLPRFWHRFLDVNKDDANPRPFYVLDYKYINKDMEKWSQITAYVRTHMEEDPQVMDKIEDMALPMAVNVRADLSLDPEDIAVIKMKVEKKIAVEEKPIVEKKEPVLVKKVDGRKRTMSQEHKEKMKAGRKKQLEERGRQAVRKLVKVN